MIRCLKSESHVKALVILYIMCTVYYVIASFFINVFQTKRQLAQYGIYSETDRSTSTNAASHYSLVSNLTATYATVGDRGSSADSGVRLSSDRDSAGGLPTTGNLSDSANEGKKTYQQNRITITANTFNKLGKYSIYPHHHHHHPHRCIHPLGLSVIAMQCIDDDDMLICHVDTI